FSFKNSSGAIQTVNLLQAAGVAGLPSRVNANIASSLQAISGTFGNAALITTSDPNINTLNFQAPRKDTIYYPTARVDWAATENIRVFFSYGQTKTNNYL